LDIKRQTTVTRYCRFTAYVKVKCRTILAHNNSWEKLEIYLAELPLFKKWYDVA
jgi:hypothetical protein